LHEKNKDHAKVFEIERVEVTSFPKGENEVVFKLFGVRFHMLDENPKFDLKAPNPDELKSIWFNILVGHKRNIQSRFEIPE